MKAIACTTLWLLACLTLNGQTDKPADNAASGTSDNAPPSPPSITANQAVAYDLLTNVVAKLSAFGISVQVDNLTLNLNGFAMVGLVNTLTAPTAEQSIAHTAPGGNAASPTTGSSAPVKQRVSEIELREGVVRVGGGTNQLIISNTNLLSLATNLLGAMPTDGFRLHVGQLTLNLNGYALVGVTNFIESPTADQQITNAPAPSRSAHALRGAGVLRSTSPHAIPALEVGEVTLQLNGLAVFGLPPKRAESQTPDGSPAAR